MKSRRIHYKKNFCRRFFSIDLNERAIGFMALNCLVFSGQTVLFSFHSPAKFSIIFVSFLLTLANSLAALYMLNGIEGVGRVLGKYCTKALSCFLFFFFIAIGYLMLASLAMSFPMGLLLAHHGFSGEAINTHSLQTSNCALALALLTWLWHLPIILKDNSRLVLSA